jgi:hypothetical protein
MKQNVMIALQEDINETLFNSGKRKDPWVNIVMQ